MGPFQHRERGKRGDVSGLVVYDSFFGNTEQVARAIGQALPSLREVQVVRVTETNVEQLAEIQVLIVGSPTRGFRPSELIGSYLKAIPLQGLKGVKVAAFDTRIGLSDIRSPALRLMVRTGGYAAQPIADQLKSKGGEVLVPAEGFLVRGEKGPLKDGELDRAAAWARQIEEALQRTSRGT